MNGDLQYNRQLKSYFDRCLPEKIYDAHFHLSRRYTARCGYPGSPYEQYTEYMADTFGRSVTGGLLMPMPNGSDPLAVFEEENAYTLEVAREHGFDMGLLVRPGCSPEKTIRTLEENPEIRILKPYLCYSTAPDPMESDIRDYAPDWMWEIANQRQLPVMIHLSHYQNLLSDPANLAELHRIHQDFPRAKIWLAHCAMGHHVHKLKIGLEHIRDIPNVWFDCSGVSEAVSIAYCVKAFGPERVMYGSDFDFAKASGRICSLGSNFLGLHSGYMMEDVLYPDYKYQPISVGAECLLALLQACELLELSREQVEGIFYHNAFRLLGARE